MCRCDRFNNRKKQKAIISAGGVSFINNSDGLLIDQQLSVKWEVRGLKVLKHCHRVLRLLKKEIYMFLYFNISYMEGFICRIKMTSFFRHLGDCLIDLFHFGNQPTDWVTVLKIFTI